MGRELLPTDTQIILQQKAALAATNVLFVALKLRLLLLKANFDPNQPRLPRGHRHGGRWTRPEDQQSFDQEPYPLLDMMPTGSVPEDDPEGKPPTIPPRRPRGRQLTKILIEEATWLLKRGARAIPLVRYLEYADWLRELAPLVRSYLDEPRSLSELQARAGTPRPGYDRHHIVEQDSARAAGFPESMINAPDNLALVPRIRHHQINRWYSMRSDRFGGLSPRQYLRDNLGKNGVVWVSRR